MSVLTIRTVFFDLGSTLVTKGRNWVPGATNALDILSNANIELGVISNTGDWSRERLRAEALPADFDFSRFDERLVVLSSEVSIQKPSAQIFALAVDRTGLPPRQVAFCGEDLEETVVASSVGLLGVRLGVQRLNGAVTWSDIAHVAEQIVTMNSN